ncbi:hypothetical protein GPALN_012685 [Globodera pallida]|nr:hypothetical protein GPALN_012685 [Globodera pallida]
MSDNKSDDEQQQQMEKIFICADVLLGVFAFLGPLELGLKVALISDRFGDLVDLHFKSRKWSLDGMQIRRATDRNGAQIVNARSREGLPIPQEPLPDNVIGFKKITICYIDRSVIELLQRIRRLFDSSGTNVFIGTDSEQSRSCEIIRQKIWPLLNDNIRGFHLTFSANLAILRRISPAILCNCPKLGAVHSMGLFPEFPAANHATATAGQVLAKWLLTPRGDGLPKILYCAFYAARIDELKESFANASERANFIIKFLEDDGFVPFELNNNWTGERLTFRRIDKNKWLLVRCPLAREEDKWANWEKEAIQWESDRQWNFIAINFEDGDIGDGEDDEEMEKLARALLPENAEQFIKGKKIILKILHDLGGETSQVLWVRIQEQYKLDTGKELAGQELRSLFQRDKALKILTKFFQNEIDVWDTDSPGHYWLKLKRPYQEVMEGFDEMIRAQKEAVYKYRTNKKRPPYNKAVRPPKLLNYLLQFPPTNSSIVKKPKFQIPTDAMEAVYKYRTNKKRPPYNKAVRPSKLTLEERFRPGNSLFAPSIDQSVFLEQGTSQSVAKPPPKSTGLVNNSRAVVEDDIGLELPPPNPSIVNKPKFQIPTDAIKPKLDGIGNNSSPNQQNAQKTGFDWDGNSLTHYDEDVDHNQKTTAKSSSSSNKANVNSKKKKGIEYTSRNKGTYTDSEEEADNEDDDARSDVTLMPRKDLPQNEGASRRRAAFDDVLNEPPTSNNQTNTFTADDRSNGPNPVGHQKNIQKYMKTLMEQKGPIPSRPPNSSIFNSGQVTSNCKQPPMSSADDKNVADHTETGISVTAPPGGVPESHSQSDNRQAPNYEL